MLGFALEINENVINEDHYELVQFIMKTEFIRYMK
jgi:hypothetical protein